MLTGTKSRRHRGSGEIDLIVQLTTTGNELTYSWNGPGTTTSPHHLDAALISGAG